MDHRRRNNSANRGAFAYNGVLMADDEIAHIDDDDDDDQSGDRAPLRPAPANGVRAWVRRQLRRARDAADEHVPVLAGAVRIADSVDLAERAAALALFTMLAAVPGILGALSVAGFVFERMGDVAAWAGVQRPDGGDASARLLRVVQEALPGISWDPSKLAGALVEHRTANGLIGSIGTLIVGANLMARADAAVRTVLGRRRRSFWRAAGATSVAFVAVALLALIPSLAGPVIEWSLRLAVGSVKTISLGQVDAIALIVAVSQVIPIAALFYALVRWSSGRKRPSRRRLLAVAVVFGALWFCGQRVFSLYVSEIMGMNAIYGALTGIVALLLWLYYAALALLFAVAVLASWERDAAARLVRATATGN